MRNKFALAAIACVAGLGAWALWPRAESNVETGSVASSMSSASDRSKSGGDAGHTSSMPGKHAVIIKGIQIATPAPGALFKPMPPVTAPLRMVYADLKEQARAGDPVAQCRLGYELRHCKVVSLQLEAMQRTSNSNASGEVDKKFAIDAVCKDFTPDSDDEAWRYTLQAALNGNDAAALSFILGPTAGLDPIHPVTTLDGWEAYRDYAPRLLQQEIDRGNAAAYLMAGRNSVRSYWGIPIAAKDPIQAAAYYLALMPSAIPSLRTQAERFIQGLNLSPADLAQAHQRAAPLTANLRVPPSGTTDFSNGVLSDDGKPSDASWCEK